MRVDDLGSLMIRHVKGRPGALSVCVGEQRDEQYDNRECDQEDVNDSLSDGDHCETREPGSGSRIDVQFAVLHPWKVDSAKNLTEDSEASKGISREPHVITPSRVHRDSTVKKMRYGKTVSLSRIVIHYMDQNVLAQ